MTQPTAKRWYKHSPRRAGLCRSDSQRHPHNVAIRNIYGRSNLVCLWQFGKWQPAGKLKSSKFPVYMQLCTTDISSSVTGLLRAAQGIPITLHGPCLIAICAQATQGSAEGWPRPALGAPRPLAPDQLGRTPRIAPPCGGTVRPARGGHTPNNKVGSRP